MPFQILAWRQSVLHLVQKQQTQTLEKLCVHVMIQVMCNVNVHVVGEELTCITDEMKFRRTAYSVSALRTAMSSQVCLLHLK